VSSLTLELAGAADTLEPTVKPALNVMREWCDGPVVAASGRWLLCPPPVFGSVLPPRAAALAAIAAEFAEFAEMAVSLAVDAVAAAAAAAAFAAAAAVPVAAAAAAAAGEVAPAAACKHRPPRRRHRQLQA